MKRAISMLGAVAAIAVGFLFAAPAAHAQALNTIGPINGITCKQYASAGGQAPYYPSTFWDCIETANSPTPAERLVGSQARNLPQAMKTLFSNAGIEAMIFKNAAEFAAFTGAAAPASKYVAWTASTTGNANFTNTALEDKKIAAVFAQADLWSPNISPTNQIATRDISGAYAVHIMQAWGRWHDILTADPKQPSRPQQTPVHIFAIATEYDQFWTDRESAATVWGNAIANHPDYSGMTPWQTLDALYGATYDDIYAFQFASEFGSNWSHLQQFVNAYLHETEGYRHNEVFLARRVQANPNFVPPPVTGVYKPEAGSDPAISVMCVEYDPPNYNAPADKLWDCIHPYNSQFGGERLSGLGVSQLEPVLTGDLDTNNVRLFIMRDIVHYGVYHNIAIPANDKIGAWGYSTGVDTGVNRVSAAFYRAFTKSDFSEWITTPSQYYSTTLLHEVGHHLDGIWGRESLVVPSDFADAVFADIAHIDSGSVACTAMFSTVVCNDPKSIDGTYTNIFSVIPNVDTLPCSQVLAAAVCSGPPAGSNTTKFNAIANVDTLQCSEVFATSICNANRKLNSEIFGWRWSTSKEELWALAFQVTGPVSGPADLEFAMNQMTNLKNYMETNPDIHTNGDPNP